MKFIISLILTALLSFVACIFLPWWSIAIAAFIVAAFVPQKPFVSFITGFIALFLLWGTIALVISNNNNDLLAHKVSVIILKIDSPVTLIIATAFIGALVASFAALAGSYLHKPKQQQAA